jgi:hypothetical protein
MTNIGKDTVTLALSYIADSSENWLKLLKNAIWQFELNTTKIFIILAQSSYFIEFNKQKYFSQLELSIIRI